MANEAGEVANPEREASPRGSPETQSAGAKGAGPLFEAHGDLDRLLEGAHHRRVLKFGAPALVRMIGLWRPWSKGREGTAGGSRETTADEREALRLAEIDLTIAAVYRALDTRIDGVTEVHSDARLLRPGAKQPDDVLDTMLMFGGTVDLADPLWKPLDRLADSSGGLARKPDLRALLAKAWKRDDRANAHRSIRISFTWRGIRCHFLFELHTEFLSIMVVLDFSTGSATGRGKDALEALCKRELRMENGPLKTAGLVSDAECQQELFASIWSELEDLVRPTLSANPTALGARFADLRGIVLAPRDKARADGAFDGFRLPGSWVEGNEARLAAQTADGRCRVCHLEGPGDPDRLARDASVIDVLTYPKDMRDSELSLSALLVDREQEASTKDTNWRALLASTMKPHSPADQIPCWKHGGSHDDRYLQYVVYADPVNRWQLGRLVYRINRAGLNRVAGTMHYDKLNKIGRDLNNVERLLEQSIGTNAASPRDQVQASRESIDEVRRALFNVFNPPGEKESERDIDGPLDYRVERSRSYLSQWTRVTSALRIGRISGHQPYNEFIDQRLGAAFDFIDRLGRRYERVLHAQADLQGRFTSLETSDATKSIERIQEYGELALVAALLPYYVGYVLSGALECAVSKQLIWFLALSWGGFYFAFWRWRTRFPDRYGKRPDRAARRVFLWKAVIGFAFVAVSTIAVHVLSGGEFDARLFLRDKC